ncbi:MAG: hypothetical protein HYY17_14450 [Planctomycetes bacterium]|nr:hypothetical protein [Planctomycetota bacterium]
MRTRIALMGILALAGCGGGGGGDIHDPWYVQYSNGHPIAAEPDSDYAVAVEDDLLAMINNHRIVAGRGALIESGSVSDVARAHSVHMAIHDFEGPVNPEGDGPATRASMAGLSFYRYDEVLAAGSPSAVEVFDDWLSVPSMHDRIDDPFWTHMGGGYHEHPGSYFTYYWTVDFLEQ